MPKERQKEQQLQTVGQVQKEVQAPGRQASMQEQAQRLQERALRTQRICEQCQVIIPKEGVLKQTFAQSYTETKSAAKRRIRARMPGSALHARALNADKVLAAEAAWGKTIEQRKLAAAVDLDTLSWLEQKAICQFLTEDEVKNRKLLTQLHNGRESRSDVGAQCIRQFMALDLKVDLRNDKTFARESLRLEEIAAKTEGLQFLMRTHPDFAAGLTEDELEDLKVKLNIADKITDYYHMQRKVITNQYYKTHYNSEISARYQEEDTLEQKSLTMLLQQAEYCRARKELEGNKGMERALFGHLEAKRSGEEVNNRLARQVFQDHPSAVEYGKNNAAIEDSVHAEYFRQHNHPGDPVCDRLAGEHYRVTGMAQEMGESFVRHLSNLPRWKVVQNTPLEKVDSMIQNLVRRPEHADDPQEVRECQQANLEGLKQFKELVKRQMGYLKRKYGCGFRLLDPVAIAQHEKEFENDFTNMQGLSEFVDYLKKLPGMFDEQDPSDVEMGLLMDYYQNGCMAEGMSRNLYVGDPGNVPTYADYKFRTAYVAMHSDAVVKSEIKAAGTMHLDVRWDTQCSLSLEEVKRYIRALDVGQLPSQLENIYSKEQMKNLKWNMLFPELSSKTSQEAALDIVSMDAEKTIGQYRQQWRKDGVSFGGIRFPGLGTDDFDILNGIYRRILEDETIRGQYGITTPEIFEEFCGFMKQSEDVGELLRINDAYADTAIRMRDDMHASGSQLTGAAAGLCRQLERELNKIADSYIEKNSAFRRGEGTSFFTRFGQFRERIGMWSYPQHKEVMENTVEPEIARQEPETTVTIGGLQFKTYEGPLPEALVDRKLKEGVEPVQVKESLEEFNKEYARFQVLKRIVDNGETVEGQQGEPLWHAVKAKRGFFQFDIYMRLGTSYNRWNETLDRIKDMTER